MHMTTGGSARIGEVEGDEYACEDCSVLCVEQLVCVRSCLESEGITGEPAAALMRMMDIQKIAEAEEELLVSVSEIYQVRDRAPPFQPHDCYCYEAALEGAQELRQSACPTKGRGTDHFILKQASHAHPSLRSDLFVLIAVASVGCGGHGGQSCIRRTRHGGNQLR